MSALDVTQKAIALSNEQREISVAEFFEKNRHLLGYNTLQKALLTVVREAVDNALDACESADILPDIYVEVQDLGEQTYKVIVEDNGPGIKKENVPYVFGKLLFGSKFMKLMQTRGQQGIGISGAVLYAQLTTGKPAKIYSKIGDGKVYVVELAIDIEKNQPDILSEDVLDGHGHGIRIELILKGKYVRGKQSILEYLKETAIMNPHAEIRLVEPDGNMIRFERAVNELPVKPKEIKPHPHGIELGVLMRMLSNSSSRTLLSFLMNEFSRVGKKSALDIIAKAGLEANAKPSSLTRLEAEKLLKAMHKALLPAPPTDCLSPVGKEAIIQGLKKELLPEFTAAVSRKPKVYRGFPFLVEVGLAYGGNIKQENAKLYRYANKVPLLYEQGACALTKAFLEVDWRRYGLKKASNGFPEAPLIVSVHFASVWVPYTSESKEAISSYDDIIKEVKLALQDAARELQKYLSKLHKASYSKERKSKFERYAVEIVEALSILSNESKEKIQDLMTRLLKTHIKDYKEEIEKLQDKDYLSAVKQNDTPLSNQEDSNDHHSTQASGQKKDDFEEEIDALIEDVKKRKELNLLDYAK
ncbi:MAG: DNA topoisomerase VI subunit B [Candidatus Nanohaloarchaeota archaeon]|nr:DNA topoisomerase VI subunit B [Candidatus Nanohaloarchaeota archaeon]